MPNSSDGLMPRADQAAGMSRDVQEKLAGALILAEDAGAADSARAAQIRDYYRAAAGAEPTVAVRVAARPAPADGLTPFWLFCQPIEDLLGDEPLPLNATRMSSAVATACWEVVAERIPLARHHAVTAELAALGAGAPLDIDAIAAVGTRWWPDCEAALSAAVADTRSGRSLALAERSPKYLLEHAETIAAALGVAQPIARLKRLLGAPPVARLGTSQRAAVRTAIEQIARTNDARVAAHVIAHRMQNPAEWFAVIADLDLGRVTAHGQALSEQREAVILSHAAGQLAALEDPIASPADLAAAVDCTEAAAATLAASLQLEAHGASAAFLRDVARLQKALGDQLKDTVIPAVRAAHAAAWGASVEEPSAAALRAAEDAGRALARLGRSAALIGAESTVRPVILDIVDGVEAAIAAPRIVEASPERQSQHAAMLVGGVRLIEILAGSDRAFAVLTDHRPLLETLCDLAPATP